jgi:hypothetical protein
MTDHRAEIRIERGAPDDIEVAAVVAALVAVLGARRREREQAPTTVTWLRPPVLVPPSAWTAHRHAA